jgi:hypothetical protein
MPGAVLRHPVLAQQHPEGTGMRFLCLAGVLARSDGRKFARFGNAAAGRCIEWSEGESDGRGDTGKVLPFVRPQPEGRPEMFLYAVIVFAIAALGGLYLAAHVLRDRFAPWTVSLLHAALGALGLILLIAVLVTGPAPRAALAGFVILLIAALGGFLLASFHLRQRLPPKPVVVIHAGVAVVGFLVLLFQLF